MSKFPNLYPSKNKPDYHLSDVFIAPTSAPRRGTGATDSEHVIYFGSAPLQRIVAIKAFLESFKLNLQKEKEIIKFANQHVQKIKEKEGSLSYDITLNMPAHSVNEARNNLAKIEELQKLIGTGRDWSTAGTPVEQADGTFIETEENIGFSPLCETRLPLFWVYFRNIINGGRKITTSKITSFEQLVKHGFPCYIDKVNYEPDVESGFFEFNNYLFPKNIKLSLTLNYENQSMYNEDVDLLKNKTINSYDIYGLKDKHDTGLFPFHVDMPVRDMNDINSDKVYTKKDSYLFITKGKDSIDNLEVLNVKATAGGIFVPATNTVVKQRSMKTTDSSCPKYVIFDLFLESFSRDISYEYSKAPAGAASIYSKVVGDSTKFNNINYNMKINCVADNLEKAKKNLGKLQLLTRMFYKTTWDGLQPFSVPANEKKSEYLQKLFVYVPNMIEKPNTGKKKTSLAGMQNSSIPLFLEELSYDLDLDQGFFQEGKYLYAKAFSITFKFLYPDNDLILNYSVKKGSDIKSEDQYYFKNTPNSTVVASSNEARLFPMDKKTVRIGKSP